MIHIKQNGRVNHVMLDHQKLSDFFDLKKPSIKELEYIPYNRFLIANSLNRIFDNKLALALKDIINDYKSGVFLLDSGDLNLEPSSSIQLSTAISHLLGMPNIDLLSGKYYASFLIENTDNSKTMLQTPYQDFKMHTDGSFMHEKTDWLLLTKISEQHAKGGESRLLHAEDWTDYEFFSNHECNEPFLFAGPPSSDTRSVSWGNHRETDTLVSPILSEENGKRAVRFVDQFIHPKTYKQSKFIADLQHSLENDKNCIEFPLKPGNILGINNTFWLHGRKKFEYHKALKRTLMRQRGKLCETI